MDTPERNRVGTSISQFEDSPVFSYISNLSPIKPVKSVHITQTINPLSFLSPPSVFTSPHVGCHKDFGLLRRHNLLEAPRPKVSYEYGNKLLSNEDAFKDLNHEYRNSSELQRNTGTSIEDALIELSSEGTKFTIDLPQALNYDSGSPSFNPTNCSDETNSLLELPGELASNVICVHESPEKDIAKCEVHLQGLHQNEPKIEAQGCNWESLIPDDADLLIFNSPNETEAFKDLMQKSLDPTMQLSNFMSQLPQTTTNNGRKIHIVNQVASVSVHEIEDHPSKLEDAIDTDQMQDNLSHVAVMDSNLSEKINGHLCITHHGTRKRCLDFELAGMRRYLSISSNTFQSNEDNVPNDNQLLPTKHNVDSRRCILPRIGLHLNALPTLKDYKMINDEDLPSRRQLCLPNSSSSLHLPASQQHCQISSVYASSERDLDPQDNGEGFNQNSPKKKRCKLELAEEGEACKRCNCKKSKCLKLYCECFAAGVYCIEPCSCQGCFNKPIYEDTVLATRKQIESRNPLAFTPKVIISADSLPEFGADPNKTPASARHKRGCNCKKSGCLKKYCECFQGGVGCSIGCRCEGCKNTYGTKDGIELEPEEKELCERHGVEKALQETEIQNNEDHPDSALPRTPLQFCRSLLPLAFPSKGKPPRFSMTTTPASTLYATQNLVKPSILRSQPKFVKTFQTIPEDKIPENFQGDASPITCIRTSPNGKRISSPTCASRSSPTRRSGRKLILQSIPSFPPLTPRQ